MTVAFFAAPVLLALAGFTPPPLRALLSLLGVLAALTAAARCGGARAIGIALAAGALPAAGVAVASVMADGRADLVAFPFAAALLEVAACTAAVARRADLVDAWLAAGARPVELRDRLPRGALHGGTLVALALLVRLVYCPVDSLIAFAATLTAIWLAELLASRARLTSLVVGRLVQNVPDDESRSFRLPEGRAVPKPIVFESRPEPGHEGDPE
jgi:hypothetical protein